MEFVGVSAITNTKVEVKLSEAVEAVAAENFAITEKGSDKVLEVKDAVLESGKVVVLTTDAMKAGTAYNITVNEVSKNFTGIAKVTAAPKVKSVKCTDTNTVEVAFDKKVDFETATDVANYTINNSVVVANATLSSDRKVVTLETEGVRLNRSYKIDIENVLGADGVKMTKTPRNFVGTEDKKAPTAGVATAVNTTNNRIKLSFNDTHGIDKESAEEISNYTIKTGSTELEILSIEALDADKDGKYEAVEIVTEAQQPGKKYTITVSNLADGSALKNVVSKPLTFTIYGRSQDKQAPSVNPTSVTSLDSTRVTLKFTESNALDNSTVLDPTNYEFNNDLEALSVEIIDDSKPYSADSKEIIITTTEQTENKSYTLTVKNIADEYGNVMKPLGNNIYQKYFFTGKKVDTKAPYVTSVTPVDSTTVKLVFDSKLVKASAEDPTNYKISNSSSDLGTAVKAKLESDGVTVTLTTLEQTANKTYNVTIDGVKDYSENETISAKASFVAKRSVADTTRPTMLYAQQVSKDEVLVYFSEAVTYTNAANKLRASVSGSDAANYMELTYVDSINDDTVLVFKPAKTGTIANNVELLLHDFTNSWIEDSSKNVVDYAPTTNADRVRYVNNEQGLNTEAEVVNFEQVDARTVRVRFNKRVQTTNANVAFGIAGTVQANVSTDKTYIDYVKATPYEFNKAISVNFQTIVKDMTGQAAKNKVESITPYIVDSEKPYILNVYATDNSTIKIEFNESLTNKHLYSADSIAKAGSYRVYYFGTNGTSKIYVPGTAKIVDGTYTEVEFSASSLLDAEKTYYLEVTAGATDIAGNRGIVVNSSEWAFPGSNIVNEDYITGISLINNNTFKMADGKQVTSLEHKKADGTYEAIKVTSVLESGSTTKYVNTTVVALLEGQTYRATTSAGSFEFKGLTSNPGITIMENATKGSIDFGGIDLANQTIHVYNVTDTTQTNDLVVLGKYINTVSTSDSYHVVVTDNNNNNNVLYGAIVTPISTSATITIPVVGITIADDGAIAEGSEAGETITVTLANDTFAADIDATNWTISGMPTGITATVARTTDTTATITLAGTSADYDTNDTDMSVTVPAAALTTTTTTVSANTGVTFTATVEATPDAPLSSAVAITQPTGAAGKTAINIADTLEFRVTNADGSSQKQDWTNGTGSALNTTANVVNGDKIEVRVKATSHAPASAVYTYTVQTADIGV